VDFLGENTTYDTFIVIIVLPFCYGPLVLFGRQF
jgi:hypothetical protein